MKTCIWIGLLSMVLSVRAQETAVDFSPNPDGWTPAKRIVKRGEMEGATVLKPGPGRLLNIDFGAYWELSRGLGAVGLSTNDSWNPYAAPWKTWQTQGNLVWADGTPCPARITVENAPGQWQSEVEDTMLRTYSYSHDGGPITVTIADLPSARYDFYVYGHATETQNGAFVLSKPESSGEFEEKATSTSPRWREPIWQEGQQYVVFRNVPVLQESVEILVKPGASPIPILSGLQVVKTSELAPQSEEVLPSQRQRLGVSRRPRVTSGAAENAAPSISSNVAQGMLEEEADEDLQTAIQSYRGAIAQFDRQRPAIANAIYRLGECYRKLGRIPEAKTQYARILREFPDQKRLVELSQKQLFAEPAEPARDESGKIIDH